MIDGTLGNNTVSDYIIESKEDAKSYHANPFPIPKIHKPACKKEVQRLKQKGVIKRNNNFQWEPPTLHHIISFNYEILSFNLVSSFSVTMLYSAILK